MQKQQKINFQKIILDVLMVTGSVAVALMAPNAMRILTMFQKDQKHKKNPKYSFQNAIGRLLEKGFIVYQEKGGKRFFSITKKGEKALTIFRLRDFYIPKPSRWDKKWRIIAFDIPEKKKEARKLLRRALFRIGFVKLQNSVWVHPYECEDLMFLLKTDFQLGKEVLYIVAEEIENDKKLKEHFGLH